MSRPHSRECSHIPWQGFSLPVWLGRDCWDWGPQGLLSSGLPLVPSATLYLKIMSWEEPAALAGLIFSLSGWHKPHHYWCSFYLLDLENPKFFSYHAVFMFCGLARHETFLWWSRWLTLSSPLFIISWHLFLSFVFMVRCFSSLWVFFPDSFFKISIYSPRNMTREVFSFLFACLMVRCAHREKLHNFVTLSWIATRLEQATSWAVGKGGSGFFWTHTLSTNGFKCAWMCLGISKADYSSYISVKQ